MTEYNAHNNPLWWAVIRWWWLTHESKESAFQNNDVMINFVFTSTFVVTTQLKLHLYHGDHYDVTGKMSCTLSLLSRGSVTGCIPFIAWVLNKFHCFQIRTTYSISYFLLELHFLLIICFLFSIWYHLFRFFSESHTYIFLPSNCISFTGNHHSCHH